ncbi:MAG: hypothetical protein COB24_00050 [Hyphomicrobiales bacterium]|nr:MAG: hypothetical protein COB24_00050 [Hyphomicrobiales bacterium]
MIAIHQKDKSFSDNWIKYCNKNDIKYKIVNCYDDDIIKQLADCDGLLWHWNQNNSDAANFARQLIYSLEHKGTKVFPNSKTVWHYDDKLGQKYLLEALALPLIPTNVFYNKNTALEWAKKTNYPVVFKLSRGAGSMNVMLAHNYGQVQKIITKCFGKGWKDQNRIHALKERVWSFRRDKSLKSFFNIGRGIVRFVLPHPTHRVPRVEHNYAYFQEFIPNNDCDIRVIVIGQRAFAIKRMVREGDFRASGSGFIVYDRAEIPIECVRMSFEAAKTLETQSVALDFVFKDGLPLIVEISYAFLQSVYLKCPGYWDHELNWHDGSFLPEDFIMEDFFKQLEAT